MPEYRRFVAYVYAYVNGKKEKNTGFVKVESRAGSGRLQVRLQKIPQEEKSLALYAFVRRGEVLPGLFLGSLAVRGGRAEGTLYAPDNRLGGRWELEELAGLWLRGQKGISYVTVWDDLPVAEGQLRTDWTEEAAPEREEAAPETAGMAFGRTDWAEEVGEMAAMECMGGEAQLREADTEEMERLDQLKRALRAGCLHENSCRPAADGSFRKTRIPPEAGLRRNPLVTVPPKAAQTARK